MKVKKEELKAILTSFKAGLENGKIWNRTIKTFDWRK